MRKIFIFIIINIIFISSIFAEENRTYGPIKANESLWSIVVDMNQSSDISIQQIMLAILRKNNQAFSIQNVNALEPGSIITYPNLNEINIISKNEAHKEVEKQNKIWQNIVNKTTEPKIENKKIIKNHKLKHFANKQLKNNSKIIKTNKLKMLSEQKTISVSTLIPTIDMTAINSEIDKINYQIKSVIEKNNMLQAQLDQINIRVSFVEKSTNKLLKFDITNIFKPLKKYTQADAVVASCVASSALLLLFIIISLLSQFFKKSFMNNNFKEKEESDFIEINKKDEIAAKLNLARAYIDMGKNSESINIIDEVMANCDPIEKAEAESLLAKIT